MRDKYKEYVITHYIDKKESTIKIAKDLGISKSTVKNILEDNNIKRRSQSESRRTYFINENYFSEIDSDEKAYFLGFIYGDGCNYPEKNLLSIVASINDKEHLQKMLNLITPDKKIRVFNTHLDTQNISMEIWNKQISQDLIKLGAVKAKTKIIKFPYFLNEELYKSFIRGIFDADGCFSYYSILSHNKYDCTICEFGISSTESMCESINSILNNEIEIPIRKLKVDKRVFKGSAIYKNSNPKEIVLIYKYLYENSTIHLERKKLKFEEFFSIRGIDFNKISN